MIIQDIRDEIVTELGLDSSDTTVLALILQNIKSALRRISRHLKDRTLVTVSTVAVAANANTGTLPTDFISEREVWRLDNSSNRVVIPRRHHSRFRDQINVSTTGELTEYFIRGKTIEFDRSAVEAETIYVDHFKSVTASLALSDTFFGNEDMVEIVKDLAKGNYYLYEEDSEMADKHMGMAQHEIDEINADYMEKEFGGHVEEN